MAIALSARAKGIASHAGSADMGQDTGMGMIGIISRVGIEPTMIDITNPGDTHENITRPSGTSVPRIQRLSLTEFPKEKHGQRPSSKGCGESALAQGTYHIERTLRRLSLLHSSRKSLLEGQIGEKQ
jgi:hypothetical protein